MKISRTQFIPLFLAAAFLTCSKQTPSSTPVAVITYIQPVVKTKKAEQVAWQPAEINQGMKLKDRIETFENASATLLYKNEQQIVIDANTLVVIGGYSRDTVQNSVHSNIEIRSGRIQALTAETGPYDIDMVYNTPNAVVNATRRITVGNNYEIVIGADSLNKDLFSVYRGSVSVSSLGSAVDLKENYGTFVKKGEKPAPPRPLPQPPELLNPDNSLFSREENQKGFLLRWQYYPSAGGYRVEIAKDTSFSSVVLSTISQTPNVTIDSLLPGTYAWHVGTIDQDGIEGKFSQPRNFQVMGRIFTYPKPQTNTIGISARDTVVHGKNYVGGYILQTDSSKADVLIYALTDVWYTQRFLNDRYLPPPTIESDGYWECFSHTSMRFKIYLIRKGYSKVPTYGFDKDLPKVDGINVLAMTEFPARGIK